VYNTEKQTKFLQKLEFLETGLGIISNFEWSKMTLNYPHEGLGVPKAYAVVGGSIPGCKIATLPDEKLHCGGKNPSCVKNKK